MKSVKFKQGLLQEAIISDEQVAVQGKDSLVEKTLELQYIKVSRYNF